MLLRHLRTNRTSAADGVADEVSVRDLGADAVARRLRILDKLRLQHRRRRRAGARTGRIE